MLVRKCYGSTTLRSRELVIPRSRGLATPHSRATARPYGSEPYSRIDAENKHFLFQNQFNFYDTKCECEQNRRDPATHLHT